MGSGWSRLRRAGGLSQCCVRPSSSGQSVPLADHGHPQRIMRLDLGRSRFLCEASIAVQRRARNRSHRGLHRKLAAVSTQNGARMPLFPSLHPLDQLLPCRIRLQSVEVQRAFTLDDANTGAIRGGDITPCCLSAIDWSKHPDITVGINDDLGSSRKPNHLSTSRISSTGEKKGSCCEDNGLQVFAGHSLRLKWVVILRGTDPLPLHWRTDGAAR